MAKEAICRTCPTLSLETPPTRFSILPGGHLSMPSLRWRDADKAPTHHKLPLLGLKLSSNSFLDSSLVDDLSATTVYTIKTIEASTTVLRYGNDDNPLEIATINWPSAVSTSEAREKDNPLLIKMKDCSWSKGPVFLRSGSNPNSSRKFTIPDYSHTMKWKRYGTSYWCTTSGIKGPIATLDLENSQGPMSLVVYETLRDKSDSQVLPSFKGVSFLLLDYLIATALLCVTDVSAWMDVGAMHDIALWNDTNSGQELDVVSQFSDHSSALWSGSGELRSKFSETSLVTTFHQPPSKSCGPGRPSPDASRSMWYTDTPTIKDSLKALLRPKSATEATQEPGYPGSSTSHTSVRRPIHGLRNIPSVLPLLSQLSRPSTSTSTSCTSCTSTSLSEPELSLPLDQATTTSIYSTQQSPIGLNNKESSPSEQLPNVSKSANTLNGSESYRRPLPKPPRDSGLRRTQSSIPSTTTSAHTFRSLPPTPILEASDPNESRSPVSGNSRIHSGSSPPMKKVSQELTRWVHELKDPQQVLSPAPSPSVVFDLPPSYSSIYFARGDKRNGTTNPTAPST